MRRNPRIFRLSATAAVIALLWEAVQPYAAIAQSAPPPLPQPGQGRPDLNQGDPPARVGRVAHLTGTVSFLNQGDTSWSAASLNYPVSNGNSFWTEPSANAQLEISDSRIVMNGGTEFAVSTLDTNGLQAVASQGETYFALRDLAPNEVWAVQTPRGLVHLGGNGRYGIVVGTTEQPTLVTVIDGSAQIEGPGVSLAIAAGQTATITGTDSFQGSTGPALRDPFLTAALNAERPRPAPAVPIPTQVVSMAGGSDLADVGQWSDAPQYGRVWYPPVSSGWVPYREGHWAYVAPWGWTWVDNASWGFTPFHYGRWIEIGGRWAWTPGVVAVASSPVYAPALVTFIGLGAGIAVGAALASGSIGWVPLGPREPFHPWYHASPAYVRNVNVTHVTNINTVSNVTINNYVNRGAATSIPAAAMTSSRPVQAVARPVTPQQFAAARPIVGQQPVRPTATTAGVTPAVARQLHLQPAPAAPAAPGPAVRPRPAGQHGFVRPALTPASNTAPGHPGAVPASAAAPNGKPAVARPGALAAPEVNRPGATTHPAQPGAARPQAAAVAPHPAQPAHTVQPAPQPPHSGPRLEPQAASRPAPPPGARPGSEAAITPHPGPHAVASEPQRAVPAAIHPEPQRLAAPAPRPEPPRPEPARPIAMAPRPEPRPAPPRPEARPAPPAHPQPQEHKRPGEP